MVRLGLVKCTLCDWTLYSTVQYSTVHRKGNGEPLNGTALRFHLVVQLNVRAFLAFLLTVHPKSLLLMYVLLHIILIAYSIVSVAAMRACFISADGGLCNCTTSEECPMGTA